MPNADRLRDLVKSDNCARAFLELAARRERNQRATIVDRALTNLQNAGHDFSRSELITVFRSLDDLGCGQFIPGRRGWPSRFEWSTQIITVGRAAIGEQANVVRLESTEEMEDGEGLDWLTHTFKLRPNIEIEIELPMDLSPNEASRLAQFVSTLPFDTED